ncbi:MULTISPECIES: hypothetical protein [Burkholderia]|uniref:hypothetical protein n=1 Tax=Burkholderia TaxID=32008 RepID=UPI000B7A1248|nr:MULTISPECIES: hypothetical protein [Burkholderia]MBY4726082.1 hypothetical protein [Burkholderia contaminans]MCI3970341.1 hypothetical protein [Burkholderia sp. HI4860]MDN7788879.1 hypothetical protein [Burkholderia contaminans]OXI99454.1 hypothetical protein CFB48_29510 [Burkholderia sp. AU33647]
MLSSKIISFCRDKGWWFDDVEPAYRDALLKIGFDISSDFSLFYLHVEDGPTFISKNGEIYQVCWFLSKSDYAGRMRMARDVFKVPESYMPMDSFSGGRGFFYNTQTKEVFDIGLGVDLEKLSNGGLNARWDNFNEFIEWFFGI